MVMPPKSLVSPVRRRLTKSQTHLADHDGTRSGTGDTQVDPDELWGVHDDTEPPSEDEFFSLSSDDDDHHLPSSPSTTSYKDAPRTPRSPFVVEIETPRCPEDYETVDMSATKRLLFRGDESLGKSIPSSPPKKENNRRSNTAFEDAEIIPVTPDAVLNKKETSPRASSKKTKSVAAAADAALKKEVGSKKKRALRDEETPKKKKTPKEEEAPTTKESLKNKRTPKKEEIPATKEIAKKKDTPKKKGTPAEEAPVSLGGGLPLARSRANILTQSSQAAPKKTNSSSTSMARGVSASLSREPVRTAAQEQGSHAQPASSKEPPKPNKPVKRSSRPSKNFDPANPALSCIKIEFRRGGTVDEPIAVGDATVSTSATRPKSKAQKERSRKRQVTLPFKPERKELSSDDDCHIVQVSPLSRRKQTASAFKSNQKVVSSDDDTGTPQLDVESRPSGDLDTDLTKGTVVEPATRRLKIRSRPKRGLLVKREMQTRRSAKKQKESVVLDLTMLPSSEESGIDSDEPDHSGDPERMEDIGASTIAGPEKLENPHEKELLGSGHGSELPCEPDEPDVAGELTSHGPLPESDDDSPERGELHANGDCGIPSGKCTDAMEKQEGSVRDGRQLNEQLDDNSLLKTPPPSSPGKIPHREKEDQSGPPPVSSSPTPYIIQPAYGHLVPFPDYDPTGRTGRYQPHHRDKIVGLKGIRKQKRIKKLTLKIRKRNTNESDTNEEPSSTTPNANPQGIHEGLDSEGQKEPTTPCSGDGEKQNLTGHDGDRSARCAGVEGKHEEGADLAGPSTPQRRSPCPETLKRAQETPPQYRTAEAMKPTIDRLKKRIQDGAEPSPRRNIVPDNSKAVEAELTWRGLGSAALRDTFFRELALEYSRILAGSPICLISMWAKMMSDLNEECMEIRRDLMPGLCKKEEEEETKPLTPFEALLSHGQDSGNESSASSDCSDSDGHCIKKEKGKLRGHARNGRPVVKNEDLELPPLKIENDEETKPTGLMTPVTSPAGKQRGQAATPPANSKKRLRDEDEEVWGNSRAFKHQRRVGTVSRIVQASLRRKIALRRRRVGKDVATMAQDIVDFHTRGWKKKLRVGGWPGPKDEKDTRKGKKRRERQQAWTKVVASMLGPVGNQGPRVGEVVEHGL